MHLKITKVDADTWRNSFSEHAHATCFGKIKQADKERIDYAMLAIDSEKDLPVAYMTCRELDSESVYWQFGGSFLKGTLWSFKAYSSFAEHHKKQYNHISTLVENDNVVMLKMAMKVGFRITGIRYFKDNILCELYMEG